MKKLFGVILLFSISSYAADFIDGKHYKKISSPCGDSCPEKVVVTEYFSYACPGCYRLEANLYEWFERKKDKISLVKVPVTADDDNLKMQAKGYYIAKHFNKEKEYNKKLFNRIHHDRKKMGSDSAILGILKSIDVNENDAKDMLKSFSLEQQLNRDEEEMIKRRVLAMPTFVIGDKYQVNPNMAGGFDKFWDVVDYLISKVKIEDTRGEKSGA